MIYVHPTLLTNDADGIYSAVDNFSSQTQVLP